MLGPRGAPGSPLHPQGKSVEVQVSVGKRWKAVGRSLRTNRKGRYRLRYRFVAAYIRPVRYRFRTVVLRETRVAVSPFRVAQANGPRQALINRGPRGGDGITLPGGRRRRRNH